jgi:hypothetical protein
MLTLIFNNVYWMHFIKLTYDVAKKGFLFLPFGFCLNIWQAWNL